MMEKDVTQGIMNEKILKEMLENAVHFGHKPSTANPKMKKYFFGLRNGIYIFDLNKVYTALEEAKEFLAKSKNAGKKILFVGTKQQAADIVEKKANECGMPSVVNKWVPGLLTNHDTLKQRIKHLKDLKREQEDGTFEKYTKKEISDKRKEIEKLQTRFGGVETLNGLPDVLLVIDSVKDKIAVKEAKRLNIPVVAIVDANGDPGEVDYPVPGNDDAIKSLNYMLGKLIEPLKK